LSIASYADGDMGHWDLFMRKIQPIAARVPYMTVPGNHEIWFNFTAYKRRFAMPMRKEHESMYYGFKVQACISNKPVWFDVD
jgi:hypothetical protein